MAVRINPTPSRAGAFAWTTTQVRTTSARAIATASRIASDQRPAGEEAESITRDPRFGRRIARMVGENASRGQDGCTRADGSRCGRRIKLPDLPVRVHISYTKGSHRED